MPAGGGASPVVTGSPGSKPSAEPPVENASQPSVAPAPPSSEAPNSSYIPVNITNDDSALIAEVSESEEGDSDSSSEGSDNNADWVNTKKYSYLEYDPQPVNADFVGTVLKKLTVKRPFNSPISLHPHKGQYVIVDFRKYVLIMCMHVNRNFRVIVRDEDATTNYSSTAKSVEDVVRISGKSLDKHENDRLQVLL